MNPAIQNTIQYKTNKDTSLNEIIATQNNYKAVQACYAAKIESTNPRLREDDADEAQERIEDIEGVLITKVAPIASKQFESAKEADDRLKILNEIKAAATAAKTVNDLNGPSQRYGVIVQEQRLTNARDIVESQQELETVRSQANSMNEEAGRLKQECDLYPSVRRR